MLRYLPGGSYPVWIDGINHEFSPIPSVKEDVLAFLMNLKEIRLKPLSGQSGKLILYPNTAKVKCMPLILNPHGF
jgi:DNA-directed RNA polymerase subunit alpha